MALSLALLFGLGAADGVWGVARNTVVQLAVPDQLRGRAMSVVFLATRASTPLGHSTSGFIASLVGGPGTLVFGAALIGVTVATVGRRIPALAATRAEAPDALDATVAARGERAKSEAERR